MRWPLRDVLASRSAGVDLATGVMVAGLIGVTTLTFGAAVAPEAWMRRSHRTGDPVVWALTQPLPFMYAQEHTWQSVPSGPPDPEAAEICGGRREGRRNHAPTAALTGPPHRWGLRHCGLPTEVTLTSRWREHEVRSKWTVHLEGDALVIEAAP